MFKGDPLEWQGFWDRFQASIHNNDSLADIDGFNYLKGNLKGEALAAISGLSLSSENYKQAVAILKERYGNEQVLILAHMESMLRINKIKSKENVRGLRTLYNHIENCVRNLKALKLDSASYGSLLIPTLKDRLPDELNMIISRQLGGCSWTPEKVMEYFNNELRAQDNCALSASVRVGQQDNKSGKEIFTASGLYSQASKSLCVLCNKEGHALSKCYSVTNPLSRKAILRTKPWDIWNIVLRSHSYF